MLTSEYYYELYNRIVSLLGSLQDFQSCIGCKKIIKLLEFSERGSIMLGRSFGQNIDSEVCFMDVLIVLLLIFLAHSLTLSLKVFESTLKFLLLFNESSLNDFGPSK